MGALGLVGVCGLMIVTSGLGLSINIEEKPTTVLEKSQSNLSNRWTVVYW
jgi:hypothetical protein